MFWWVGLIPRDYPRVVGSIVLLVKAVARPRAVERAMEPAVKRLCTSAASAALAVRRVAVEGNIGERT